MGAVDTKLIYLFYGLLGVLCAACYALSSYIGAHRNEYIRMTTTVVIVPARSVSAVFGLAFIQSSIVRIWRDEDTSLVLCYDSGFFHFATLS